MATPPALPPPLPCATAARRDLLLLGLLGVLTFGVSWRFDLFDRLVEGSRSLDDIGGDEILVVMLVLTIALKVYAWRRWRELCREIVARTDAQKVTRYERDLNSAILDIAGSLIVVVDRQGRIARFNRACEELTGYAPAEVHDRPFWDLLLPGETARVREVFVALREGRFPNTHENHWVARNGHQHLIAWSNTALLNDTGEVDYVIGTGINVTERRAAEAALRDSETRFRTIFAVAAIGIVVGDLDRRILQANPAYEHMLGYTEAELRELTFPAATHPDDAEVDRARFTELVAGKRESYQIEKRYRRKDGGEVWGRLLMSLVRDAEGQPQYTIGMVEDITARRRAEEERDSVRRRLAQVREEERLALARELHDEAIQELLGIRLALQLGRRAIGAGVTNAETTALMDEGAHTLGEVVERLRRIVSGLRSAGLEELGLIAALEGYAAHIRRKEAGTGLAIDLDLDTTGAVLPPVVARVLFRAAQEGLRNVRRHAGASRAAATLRLDVSGVTLRVEDDGRGFTPPIDICKLSQSGHFGLVGLAEQLADLGGTLTVVSQPGAGTIVTASVPIASRQVHDG